MESRRKLEPNSLAIRKHTDMTDDEFDKAMDLLDKKFKEGLIDLKEYDLQQFNIADKYNNMSHLTCQNFPFCDTEGCGSDSDVGHRG